MAQTLKSKDKVKKINDKGFTLIEMSMVMVIVGIVISIMMTVLPSVMKTGKIKEARANFEKYDNALKGYAMINLRLPFADSTGDGLEDGGFSGTLPYKTLGLTNGDDVWGNRVKYAVYDNLTAILDPGTKVEDLKSYNAGFKPNIVYSSDICGDTNGINQAYVIASGGPKDLDGVNGMFDLCNGTADVGFNTETKIQASDYDDIVRALSITEFSKITL